MLKEVSIDLDRDRVVEVIGKKFGNSSHIIVSKNFLGKKVKIIFGEILKKTQKKIILDMKDLEILTKSVSRFGNSCHIILPREYAGKKLNLILEGENE